MEKSEYIIPLDLIGSHVSVSDTKEHCLVSSLKYLQKHEFVKEHRYIYAVRGNEMYIFETSNVFIQTADKSRFYDKYKWDMRKEIYTLKVIGYEYDKENL